MKGIYNPRCVLGSSSSINIFKGWPNRSNVNLLGNFTRPPYFINIQIVGNPFLGSDNRALEFLRPNRSKI